MMTKSFPLFRVLSPPLSLNLHRHKEHQRPEYPPLHLLFEPPTLNFMDSFDEAFVAPPVLPPYPTRVVPLSPSASVKKHTSKPAKPVDSHTRHSKDSRDVRDRDSKDFKDTKSKQPATPLRSSATPTRMRDALRLPELEPAAPRVDLADPSPPEIDAFLEAQEDEP
jgi:hypothetical protein